ncbi:MAG: radical SAM protein [Desulfurococcaceae archaeon]|uniref:B12-binding domain-containing radical SAM protein n=1 Tax=Staphylothermus marinus TaxID=2280 RepID=A0A7C4D913_STAMA
MGFYEIVISTDRTMMSNHHGKEFLGFLATGPPFKIPEKIWMWIAAPKVKVDEHGRPVEAPYGLRKIEAKLIDAGFKASIIDPDHIGKHLDTMKLLLIGHHDYFSYGPPSSEWWSITGREPVNRVSFRRFMENPVVRKAKEKGVKIIAGGPAAWQWLWELDYWKKWGVDTVVEGEAERIIVDLVDKALNNEPLPQYIYIGPHDTPSIEEIPVIKAASVNGLVEIMRGCPRGCRFCSVTYRPLRFIPIDKIIEEIRVNLKYGVKGVILHSEDVLLYGADGVRVKPEPVIKLHEAVMKEIGETGGFAWSHASLTCIKYAENEYKLVSKLMNDYIKSSHRKYLGVEVGIETGSPRLARKIMYAKSAPYPPEQWPSIVEEAFSIMHENNIVPAATLILGFPDETIDDVVKTAELIDRLKPYRSIIVPMFFVPMGVLKNNKWFLRERLSLEHIDVLIKCFRHTVYWAEDIMNKFYLHEWYLFPVRFFLRIFIWLAKREGEKTIRKLEYSMKK